MIQLLKDVNTTLFEDENYYKLLVDRLNSYSVYKELEYEEISVECDNLIKQWHNFINENCPNMIENRDYFIHKKNLYEIIRRVDKRRVYYKVFHNLTKINEFKLIALQCYWINTLKPFMVVNEDSKIYNSPNELFSVFLIISTIRVVFEEIYPNEKFVYPSKKRIADMVYNFKFCDLSREGTIAFVETLADNYKVGIEYILSNN